MIAAAMTKDLSRSSDLELDLRRSPAWTPRADQLDGQTSTLRDMLKTLDTLTAAGQRHSMGKIVAFLSEHVPGDRRKLGSRDAEALAHLLLSLTHESQRYSPDAALFSRQAESILRLMGALAPHEPS